MSEASENLQAARAGESQASRKYPYFAEKAALLRDRIIELRKDEELLSPLTRFSRE